MEEVAYTWFNRFIALRFMEVNGYLPSYTRVFSDDNGAFNPQILKDAIHLDIDGLDMEKVYAMEEANETEALFKYLVITQCNDLNRMLPGMFQKISDYTELLFPDFLLREGSVVHQMVTTIPEDDWKDAVQIIGWLYQYYNAEPKDEVFAALKKNIKISKEKIPAATQLFTPDWIVRYMVENSLGRLWVEGHPNDELKANWKYYLEEAPQEPKVEEQLKKIRSEYAQIDPASILCCDPCMGSGHILVYMFDVLMQIYLAYGYTTNEAVESIVRNNLWGMDIDDRAAQLAYFAVMMKAQQYDHRWLAKQVRHSVQPNVFALQDSGDWPTFERQMRQAFTHHPSLMEEVSIKTAKALFETFADAKEYGSIIQPEISLEELNMLENTLDEMAQKADLMDFVARSDAMTLMETLKPLIRQCRGLVQKYHAVVTNPPYMGNKSMSIALSEYVKRLYPDSKSDMFAVFVERCSQCTVQNGNFALITQPSLLTLLSFEKLRRSLITNHTISSLIHFGRGIFGIDFGSTAFVINKTFIDCYKSEFYRPHERTFQYLDPDDIRVIFLRAVTDHGFRFDFSQYNSEEQESRVEPVFTKIHYSAQPSRFLGIPTTPFCYWISDVVYSAFDKIKPLSYYAEPKQGLATADNDRFLRLWHEVDYRRISFCCQTAEEAKKGGGKWFPYNKGGSYRKWYGNNEYIVDWENDGYSIKSFSGSVIRNPGYYFRSGLTWGALSAGPVSFRYSEVGFIFDSKGPVCFPKEGTSDMYLLALANSTVARHFLKILAPTMDFNQGPIGRIPFLVVNEDKVQKLAERAVFAAKRDWDSYENSWDFRRHPLVTPALGNNCQRLMDCWLIWKNDCEEQFQQLKDNEEELNLCFIESYGLQDELTSDVDDKDVTVRKADLGRDIRSLISYAVGCMLGRYSLDKPGLAFAGGTWDESQYVTYHADHDGILPITDDEYFDDDIVGKFVEWVRTVYGAETLEANLKFIADALGGKGNPREVIRQYFLNDFYKDHLKIYQKRPIYWLFDSGKKNGFKCLIYMHRYQPDTIARIRTDYLHETQARYRNAIETLERQSANASTGERVKMTKRLNALKAQAEEARVYEEKIHHLADQMIKIDLDDGVKVNYAKFADVLAPIK